MRSILEGSAPEIGNPSPSAVIWQGLAAVRAAR
jgi:hypothetical protein